MKTVPVKKGILRRLSHSLRVIALLLPLPNNFKVQLYYSVFTDFFMLLSRDRKMFNYGQETLCKQTVATLSQQGHWLDVGCGVGGPAIYLAEQLPDINITGINITVEQVALAQHNLQQADLTDRVNIIKGDACAMPFNKNAIFDGLYAIETAFHFPDKKAFIEEAFRVLKPGAVFSCADMVIREAGISKNNALFTHIFHSWLGVMNMYKASEWQTLLETVGFKNIIIEDVTDYALKEGLTDANQRIKLHREEIEQAFPKFIINSVYKGNQWVINDVESRPIRYVIIRAEKP